MSPKQWLFSFSIVLPIILAGVFLFSQTHDSESLPITLNTVQNGTPRLTSPIVSSDTSRPCKSNEEWHQKADQTGAWIDGVLIDPKISDTEILTIPGSYNISTSKIRFLEPHYIGYYIEVPEMQYQQMQKTVESNQTTINISFTSSMYAFTNTSVRNQKNLVVVPVMIAYSSQMNETETYQDLLNRGIPIRKSKIIEIDYERTYSPSARERLLLDLANDDRVLFTYKAYIEGVLC
jgi:hypothetical protein